MGKSDILTQNGNGIYEAYFKLHQENEELENLQEQNRVLAKQLQDEQNLCFDVINELEDAIAAADELTSLVLNEAIDWPDHEAAWGMAIEELKLVSQSTQPMIKEMVPFSGEQYRDEALRLQAAGRKLQMSQIGKDSWIGGGLCFNMNGTIEYRLLPLDPPRNGLWQLEDVPPVCWLRNKHGTSPVEMATLIGAGGINFRLLGVVGDGVPGLCPWKLLFSHYEWSVSPRGPWSVCGILIKPE